MLKFMSTSHDNVLYKEKLSTKNCSMNLMFTHQLDSSQIMVVGSYEFERRCTLYDRKVHLSFCFPSSAMWKKHQTCVKHTLNALVSSLKRKNFFNQPNCHLLYLPIWGDSQSTGEQRQQNRHQSTQTEGKRVYFINRT